MARFKADEVSKYSSSSGGGGFFNIANDKEVKAVRFLYDSVDDIEGTTVHKIKLKNKDGELKDRYVNCLRAYDDPIDMCPFCREKIATQARLFIPLYNIDEDEVQVWDRGKTMFQKLVSQCERAVRSKKGDATSIVNHVFEVERNGKPKDKKTTYELYEVHDHDYGDASLDDFEIPQIIGPKSFVLDKSADEMEYYLEEDEFPPIDDDSDDEEEEAPVRRGRERRDSEERESRSERRRTPARSSKKNEDVY